MIRMLFVCSEGIATFMIAMVNLGKGLFARSSRDCDVCLAPESFRALSNRQKRSSLPCFTQIVCVPDRNSPAHGVALFC